jgi:alginate O-acetyltransferase complex protein AlgJ
MSQVIVGDDGYLFLTNDSNRNTDQFQGAFPISINGLGEISSCHRERSAILAANGGLYIHLVVPNKETVLSHLMPDQYRYQRYGLTPYNLYEDLLFSDGYASFFRPNHLRRLHNEQITFARLDTHWTHFGALSYLRECFRYLRLRDEFDALSNMSIKTIPIQQTGDLGKKIGMPDEDLLYLAPAATASRTLFDNSITNDGHVRFYRNERAAVRKRVVIHHDSTAEWVINFLRDIFQEVLMIHYPSCDGSVITSLKPDIFLFVQIERFFVREISNALDIERFLREQEVKKNCSFATMPFIKKIISESVC